MSRYLCIHGHFYQPPRENPWLESIDVQDSAAPFHDWNARILAECYLPNASSRILDEAGRIVRIVNNYERISFNFGPTLLSWLELEAPESYAAILDADRASRERFGGHGSAIAQVYNHPILPLCNARDKRTQVAWGLADFERRFGRKAEGMWLPETAVDTASLEELAAQGVAFTVLAPAQAKRSRPLGAKKWRDGPIDTRRAYCARLPSGRSIALFFYDGPLSQRIAFERLLSDGKGFAERLQSGFGEPLDDASPRLVHVATDGETYGHHHRFGDMALAYALHLLDEDPDVELTNYGRFLELAPPMWEVEISEETAWSCAHGLGRWQRDCGCRGGGEPGWDQRWREPLRASLDWLRDELGGRYERAGGKLMKDPWAARDAYIEVILDRSERTRDRFAEQHLGDDRERAFALLEMQRNLLLAYTSCAWFFDEISGIETTQVLRYAARALDLARRVFEGDLEPGFLERLANAPSNVASDGKAVYQERVAPDRVRLEDVAANFAAAHLMEGASPDNLTQGYEIDDAGLACKREGERALCMGHVTVRSRSDLQSATLACAFVHLGGHDFSGAVRHAGEGKLDRRVFETIAAQFSRGEASALVRTIDLELGPKRYELIDLFADQRRFLLGCTLDRLLGEVQSTHHRLYDRHAPLLRYMHELDMPPPPVLAVAADRALHGDLSAAMRRTPIDRERIDALIEQAESVGVAIDREGLGYEATATLDRQARAFSANPESVDALRDLGQAARALGGLPIELRPQQAQDRFWQALADPPADPIWRELATDVAAALGFAPGAKPTGASRSPRRTPST